MGGGEGGGKAGAAFSEFELSSLRTESRSLSLLLWFEAVVACSSSEARRF